MNTEKIIEEVDETKQERQEAALDTLYPKPPASTPAPAEVLDSPGESTGSAERNSTLTELIEAVKVAISSRVNRLNADNTKDGSQPGVNLHGTRLHQAANVVLAEMDNFVLFLKKEGLE